MGPKKSCFGSLLEVKSTRKHAKIARRYAAYELGEAAPTRKGSTDGGTGFPPKTVFLVCPKGYGYSSGCQKDAVLHPERSRNVHRGPVGYLSRQVLS